MSTTLTIPQSEILPRTIAATLTVNNNVALRDQLEQDAIEAHRRERKSPQDYFYAVAGAFAEGHYTEF